MPQATITVEQIKSPIRRPCVQRKTLKGLRLNRIGRMVDLPDTPAIRGMIAKVHHLVRVVYATSELEPFVAEVTAEYHHLRVGPGSRVTRGNVLWEQFEAAVAAYHASHGKDERALIERVNELAVAKLLAEDPALQKAHIEYEPDLLPDGRKIDFVVDRGKDNLYVEVKTVRPKRPRRKPTENSKNARSGIRRTSNSWSIPAGWAEPSTATPSPRAHIFSTTPWPSRSVSRPRKRSGPVRAFWCSAATASPGAAQIWKTGWISIISASTARTIRSARWSATISRRTESH